MSCPFCHPDGDNDQQVVLSNEHCLYLQKEDVVLRGAGVVVPRRHCETVFDLSPDEWRDTYELLQEAKTLVDERHHPDGYNVGWNAGRAAGQDIPHAHLHVLPRYEEEPLAGRGIRYWLKQEENRMSR